MHQATDNKFEPFPLWHRLIRETLPRYYRVYLLGLVCTILVAASASAFALLTRSMVNDILVEKSTSAVWFVSLAVVCVALIKGFSTYFQTVLVGTMKRKVISSFQERQFAKLLELEIGFLDRRHPSKQIARVVHCANAAANVLVTLTTSIVRDVLTLVGLAAVMFVQEPTMSLLALLGLPVALVFMAGVTRRVRNLSKGEEEVAGRVHAVGSEAIHGIRTVKTFALEEKASKSFNSAVATSENRTLKLQRLGALSSPVMETLGGIIIGLFIIYASWQSIGEVRTPGEFMAFIVAFLFAYEPAKRLAGVNAQLQRHSVAVGRMYRLIDRRKPKDRNGNTSSFGKVRGTLEFVNVGFDFTSEAPALQDVSFTIEHGKCVAVVGRSGAGKTTIANLILRLLEPTCGKILLDGIDISSVPVGDLRKQVALVSQDVFLFESTIRDNIRDGHPDASDAEIKLAARRAHVTEFTDAFPEGLDTKIGPNATNLSGGQRQRIAIARALLKRSPLIILDEATSALDGESERAILRMDEIQSGKRTVIIIAHRLSTIRAADSILLLDDGHLIASGTHEKLEADSDLYRSLFHLGPKYDVKGAQASAA